MRSVRVNWIDAKIITIVSGSSMIDEKIKKSSMLARGEGLT